MGGLTNGRMLIAQSAVDSLKIGVAIAIRYALLRPQFGGKPIMGYVTHQLRLLPALADAYGLHLAMGELKNIAFAKPSGSDVEKGKLVHVMSSGLKAASTWLKIDGLQKCRECCGGQGFLAANKIGPMAVDTNVDATFEGDNTVMMQQVAKALVDAGLKAARGGAPAMPAAPRLAHGVQALAHPSDETAASIVAMLQFRYGPSSSLAAAVPIRLRDSVCSHVTVFIQASHLPSLRAAAASMRVTAGTHKACVLVTWSSRHTDDCGGDADRTAWRRRLCKRRCSPLAWRLARQRWLRRPQTPSRRTWTSPCRRAGRTCSC